MGATGAVVGADDTEIVTDCELFEFGFDYSIDIGKEMFLLPDEIVIVAGASGWAAATAVVLFCSGTAVVYTDVSFFLPSNFSRILISSLDSIF